MFTRSGWRSQRLARLAARDGLTCQICGGALSQFVKDARHPLFVTVDHIIPVSRGGGGQMSNLRLTHLRCNQERGNIPISSDEVRR